MVQKVHRKPWKTRVRDKRGLKRRDSDADKVSGDYERGRLMCFGKNGI